MADRRRVVLTEDELEALWSAILTEAGRWSEADQKKYPGLFGYFVSAAEKVAKAYGRFRDAPNSLALMDEFMDRLAEARYRTAE